MDEIQVNPLWPLVMNLPFGCAHLDCANKLSQGQFTITTIGKVRMRLFLCSPCSKALIEGKSNGQ